jgi:hypothetical protein
VCPKHPITSRNNIYCVFVFVCMCVCVCVCVVLWAEGTTPLATPRLGGDAERETLPGANTAPRDRNRGGIAVTPLQHHCKVTVTPL